MRKETIAGRFKAAFIRVLRAGGYQLINVRAMQRSVDGVNWPPTPPTFHDADGFVTEHLARYENDARFQAAWRRGLKTNQGVDPGIAWRIHVGLWAAAVASRVPGDFVECGVNAGFVSSAILTYLDWAPLGKRFFLVDTFDGPPLEQLSTAEVDGGSLARILESVTAGAYVTDLDAVRRNYAEWERIEIVRGVVPDILPSVAADPVAFLHLDMNCTCPEVEALRFFWKRMSPGGVVLMDDYSRKGYEPLGNAMDALAAELGREVLSLPTGQGVLVA